MAGKNFNFCPDFAGISVKRMAKILGDPGRYVADQSAKKHRWFVLSAMAGMCLLSFLLGAFLVLYFGGLFKSATVAIPFSLAVMLFIVLIGKIVDRRMDQYDRERRNYMKGATGELAVAQKIDDLTDEFCVIHDLPTPFGNLDHVVIGPTGVFVLETKNWKGVVSADGEGGIHVNGKPPLKNPIKPLIGRMMSVRDKVKVLCDAVDELPYFNALLVFPSARIDARWGQTGKARCLNDEQVHKYITEVPTERRLNAGQIEQLANAFRALATMKKEFGSQAAKETKGATRENRP